MSRGNLKITDLGMAAAEFGGRGVGDEPGKIKQFVTGFERLTPAQQITVSTGLILSAFAAAAITLAIGEGIARSRLDTRGDAFAASLPWDEQAGLRHGFVRLQGVAYGEWLQEIGIQDRRQPGVDKAGKPAEQFCRDVYRRPALRDRDDSLVGAYGVYGGYDGKIIGGDDYVRDTSRLEDVIVPQRYCAAKSSLAIQRAGLGGS